MEKTIHQWRNIKRFREMLGYKQEALAIELGDDWTQKRVSVLEQKEEIDDKLLEQVAAIFKVPVEAIKNFDVDQAIHNINNTFHDNAIQNQINPMEKIIEIYEEKIVGLYERMLQTEREKVALLERLLDKE